MKAKAPSLGFAERQQQHRARLSCFGSGICFPPPPVVRCVSSPARHSAVAVKRLTAELESTPFEEHIRALLACDACPRVQGRPVTGAVSGANVMLVGQAPGPREAAEGKPFAYTAGRTLFRWFETLGVDQEAFRRRVHIGAVIRCFPGKDEKSGGDRVPDREEIARCASHLDRELLLLRPQLVIVVGTLASQQLLGVSVLASVVGVLHRVSRAGVAFDAVALPHPSGRSTWLNRTENRALLERSLELIRQHPAFRRTVAGP